MQRQRPWVVAANNAECRTRIDSGFFWRLTLLQVQDLGSEPGSGLAGSSCCCGWEVRQVSRNAAAGTLCLNHFVNSASATKSAGLGIANNEKNMLQSLLFSPLPLSQLSLSHSQCLFQLDTGLVGNVVAWIGFQLAPLVPTHFFLKVQ